MVGNNMYNQAEFYKQKVLTTLTHDQNDQSSFIINDSNMANNEQDIR